MFDEINVKPRDEALSDIEPSPDETV